MLGMIKTATHKRIVAEKDAEIAGLMKRVNSTFTMWDELHAENLRLRARLAPFTKIRNRDSRGRFIKDTVV